MKKFIITIVVLAIGISTYAWVEPLQIYERFAQIPGEKVDVYKVEDGEVTCYITISPMYEGHSKNQSISCVKVE